MYTGHPAFKRQKGNSGNDYRKQSCFMLNDDSGQKKTKKCGIIFFQPRHWLLQPHQTHLTGNFIRYGTSTPRVLPPVVGGEPLVFGERVISGLLPPSSHCGFLNRGRGLVLQGWETRSPFRWPQAQQQGAWHPKGTMLGDLPKPSGELSPGCYQDL